jgi:hypothetical protein
MVVALEEVSPGKDMAFAGWLIVKKQLPVSTSNKILFISMFEGKGKKK